MARELARYNVTVSAVCPGYFDTSMTAQIPDHAWEEIARAIPRGHKGQPEEIARVVRFLVAEGDYTTGQEINANRGSYLRVSTEYRPRSRRALLLPASQVESLPSTAREGFPRPSPVAIARATYGAGDVTG